MKIEPKRMLVVVPGALQSDARDPLPPPVRQRLARAERHPDESFDAAIDAGAAAQWLWRRFGGTGAPTFAPYAWHAERGEPPARQTWFCEPVHFAVARDHLMLRPLDAPPDPDEIATLLDAANAVASASGATLFGASGAAGSRWTMQFDRPWQLATTPLTSALGASIFELMPEGADARLWRKLLNDIQVEWHQLSVNSRREERGQLPVNALWLHGGGTWSALAKAGWSSVTASDPTVRGWALAAGIPVERIHVTGPAYPAAGGATGAGDALVVDTSLVEPAHVAEPARSRAWTALLDRVLACFEGDGVATIQLLLAGERTIRPLTLRRSDAWRVWRRALPELLAE